MSREGTPTKREEKKGEGEKGSEDSLSPLTNESAAAPPATSSFNCRLR